MAFAKTNSLNPQADAQKREQSSEKLRLSASSATIQQGTAINFDSPDLFRPKIDGKTVVLPSSWRDDEED